MNPEQIKSLIDQLKGAGLDDEKILNVFFETFQEGKMSREDLETLASHLGYELSEEFKNDAEKDPIDTDGDNVDSELDNATKGEIDDLKEKKPGESDDEFENKVEDVKDKIDFEDSDEEEDSDDEDSDDEYEEEDSDEEVDEEEDEILKKYYKV